MTQLLPYLNMFKRSWWIIALTTLAAFTLSLLAAYNSTPMYRVSASFVVTPTESLFGRDFISSLNPLDNRSLMSTYAEILHSKTIIEETAVALQIDEDTLGDYDVLAIVLPDANVLRLTAIGPDPTLATVLANSMGRHAINYINGLYQIYTIRQLDPAIQPESPYSPRPLRDGVFALVLGGMLGVILAFAREQIHIALSTEEAQAGSVVSSGAASDQPWLNGERGTSPVGVRAK